jgi:hypothetical protein
MQAAEDRVWQARPTWAGEQSVLLARLLHSHGNGHLRGLQHRGAQYLLLRAAEEGDVVSARLVG